MAHQPKIGLTILAVASMHSVTNAFVPLENHARLTVSTFDRNRSLPSRRGYSKNNIDDNNNTGRFLNPEPIDPTSSSSSDPIDFLINDESSFLNEVQPSPIVFSSESTQSDEGPNVNASAILAENAAILSSGSSDTIDLGFDLNLDSTTNPAKDASEDVLINEHLEAVLAASGEAAAAAEASMSQELVEHLDELAVEALNATNLNTNSGHDQIDILLPEVVPTIATIAPSTIVPEQQEQQMPQTSIVPNMEDVSGSPELDVVSESANEIIEKDTAIDSAPSVRKILKFAIPAIGVWLCGPILSLIDTSAVGVLSGTVQQAALNPAVAVTDYAALLIVSSIIG